MVMHYFQSGRNEYTFDLGVIIKSRIVQRVLFWKLFCDNGEVRSQGTRKRRLFLFMFKV